MRKLTVNLAGGGYDIRIGAGLLGALGEEMRRFTGGGERIAVVTDENVWKLYHEAFAALLQAAGQDARTIVLPPGEGTKSLEQLSCLYGDFADMGLGRGGLVAAFGGGVVGDLAGFAAATYMRGVRYIQIPTTLLAQVDSSVGGKTAVNLPQGKNLAGAFHQPRAVFIDPLTLRTLNRRDYRGGMAEVIKYGAIASRALFHRLHEKPDDNTLADIIADCCEIKAGIVARDEREQGERMLLNFGHTFGHAIEKRSGYAYTHGEAVAAGMALAAALGEEMGLTAPGTAARIRRLLGKYGLQSDCPYAAGELLPLVRMDKKGCGDGVRLILLREIGQAFARPVAHAELERLLPRGEGRLKRAAIPA